MEVDITSYTSQGKFFLWKQEKSRKKKFKKKTGVEIMEEGHFRVDCN